MKTKIMLAGEEAEAEAGKILKQGGIVAFPTDTVYGLGAIYKDTDAVQKIFSAKGRDEGKPLSILISRIEQVNELTDSIPASAGKLMEAFWPGALTVIIRKNGNVPDCVTAGGSTVGIRMPASDTARNIIEQAGSPLAAPSANTSGKRSSVDANEVAEDLDGKIDMIVDGGRCDIAVSSTVVEIKEDGYKILRAGVITQEMLDDVLNK